MPVATRTTARAGGHTDGNENDTLMVRGAGQSPQMQARRHANVMQSHTQEELNQRFNDLRKVMAPKEDVQQQEYGLYGPTCLSSCLNPTISSFGARPTMAAPHTAPAPRMRTMDREAEEVDHAGARANAARMRELETLLAKARQEIDVQVERATQAEEQREMALRLAQAARATSHAESVDDLDTEEAATPTYTPLNTAQIKANLTSFDYGDFEIWRAKTISVLGKSTKHWAKLMQTDMDESAYLALEDTAFHHQDEHNSSYVQAMLDPASVNVSNLWSIIVQSDKARREQNLRPIADSAFLLINLMQQEAGCGIGAKRTARVAEFKNKNHFTGSMHISEFIAAGDKMLREYQLLPESERKDQNGEFLALLSKMRVARFETDKLRPRVDSRKRGRKSDPRFAAASRSE